MRRYTVANVESEKQAAAKRQATSFIRIQKEGEQYKLYVEGINDVSAESVYTVVELSDQVAGISVLDGIKKNIQTTYIDYKNMD